MENKKKAMSLQLSESDYQKLQELCDKFSMSKSGMIRWLIVEKHMMEFNGKRSDEKCK